MAGTAGVVSTTPLAEGLPLENMAEALRFSCKSVVDFWRAGAMPPELLDYSKISPLISAHLADRGHHRINLFVLLTFGL